MRGGAANGGRQDYVQFGESGSNPTIYTEVTALLDGRFFFELCTPILHPRLPWPNQVVNQAQA